jgi:cell division septation protein DedD
MAMEDSDITIGPAKLGGLFFMLVAICGVFFSIGYSLGKTSAREQAMNDKAPLNASLTSPIVGDSSVAKPSAVVPAKSDSDGGDSQSQAAAKSGPDLTFYNSVKQTDRNAPTQTAASTPAAPPKSGHVTSIEQPVSDGPMSATAPANPAPESKLAAKTTTPADSKPAVTTAPDGGFVVQIAAVTREEDAAALAGALRKKSYSVFVVNNPAVHDKFYHVQVGPFSTLQDAESMKAKLTGEGYNPIVKRS